MSNLVGPSYFETLGIPMAEGREFTEQDRRDTAAVAIVNETLARRLWPSESAVGKTLFVNKHPCEVVGIVKDAQYYSEARQPIPFVYTDFWQEESISTFPIDSRIHVRVVSDPRAILPRIRKELAALDPDVPVSEDRPLTEWLDYSFRPVRVASAATLCFGVLALFLSAIGLYGVLAYTVREHTREIAIRIVLGADRSDIAGLLLGQGVRLVIAGAGIGLIAALAGSRYLSSLLYGVPQYDPVAFSIAPVMLTIVGLLASYVPARRAMRVDPMVALRYE